MRPISPRSVLPSLLLIACAGAFASAQDASPPQDPDDVTFSRGEKIDPSLYGEAVIEGWEPVLERNTNRPADWDPNPKDREGQPGQWVVPGINGTFFPASGIHNVTNKWGDTSMGIRFPEPVHFIAVSVAAQGGEGAWTTAIRAIGFRHGRAVVASDWFRDVDETPDQFLLDFHDVDRIVFESKPVLNGGGWYALDDLTFTRSPKAGEVKPQLVIIDFEDARYDQNLTGGDYRGVFWEPGAGDFQQEKAADDRSDPVHPPMVPPGLEEEQPDIPAGLGTPPSGFATLPELISQFEGIKRGDELSWTYPPDTCGAVGPDHFLVVINRVIAAYDKHTGELLTSSSLGAFLPGSNGDPRVLFDQQSGRWIVIITDFDERIYLGFSLSDDPAANWFKTSFVVSQGFDSGRWPDYPTLGVDEHGIYTSAYMVGGDASMSIFAIDKAPLLSITPSLGTVTAFRGLPWEGAIQPVHTFGAAPGQYFVSRRSSSSINVRLLTGSLTSPSLSSAMIIDTPPHENPPNAAALGSIVPISTVGTRLINGVYRDGRIWTAHTIGVNGRAGCRWYEIDADDESLAQWGTVADEELGFFFPSVMLNDMGDAILGFSGCSPGEYVGSYYTGRRFNDPWGQMATPVRFREGSAPYNLVDGFGRNRWGDYTLGSVDPEDGLTLWTIQEFVYGEDVWGTEIAQLEVPPGPDNDWCMSTTVAEAGLTEFSTVGATTDGPEEPDACADGGYTHIEADVWFKFFPPCTGQTTISLCGSDFNTKLAVYNGCPALGAALLVCDDDGCGDDAEVTFFTEEGSPLRLRIGGVEGATGNVVMTITCEPGDTCPWDFDDSGEVGFSDLLWLLSAWGPCPAECPWDLDGSGSVGFADLIELLSAWGPCE